jgi:site-specific recombinase XerD
MYLTKNQRSPFWQLIYKDAIGNLTSISTKEKTKAAALNFLTNFSENKIKKLEAVNISIKDFKKEYLDLLYSTRSKSYHRSIKYVFDVLINFTGNDIEILKLDHKIMEKFISSTFEKSESTAALYYRSLKAAFEKALDWGYIKENPFKKFKIPRIPKSIPVFINTDELELILEQTKSQLMKDIFLTGFHTGMRIGEILNLQWNAVDMNKRIIKVQNTETFQTKNKKERVIPINNVLLPVFQRLAPKVFLISGNQLVFYKLPDIKLNVDHVSKTFKKAVLSTGLNNKIHLHSLRHSFASNLVQRGVSLFVVKELLGHSDFSTTQIYSHLKNDNLIEAVRTLEVSERKEVCNGI